MSSPWDKTTLARAGLDATSTATSFGFTAAKLGTKLGFSATRGIASAVANLTGSAVDYTLFGGRIGAGAILSNSISSAISFTEKLALLPLELGEGLTSASIVAAHGAINTLAQLFPGSDDASFSLVSFVQLVRKERTQPVMKDHLPEDTEEYGVAETTRALVAWGALQSVTVGWKERQWMKHMREIDVHDVDEDKSEPKRERKESRIRVNSNVVYPGQQGQIITADIEDDDASSGTSGLPGHAKTVHLGAPGPSTGSATSTSTATMKPVPIRQRTRQRPLSQMTDSEVKSTLRRLSKLVLAGYGGASLWFFGVSPIPTKKADEQASLTSAIDASETEAVASSNKRNSLPKAEEISYAWWNLLMGKHDKEIFDSYANADEEAEQRAEERRQEASQRAQTAVVGDHGAMPRFWVLSDHTRREIVLVIRGTMSLNELAVDLTCIPAEFAPARTPKDLTEQEPEEAQMPGYAHFPTQTASRSRPKPNSRGRVKAVQEEKHDGPIYHVHGGMLRMSKLMGGHDKPVHSAVRDALRKHRGYDLVMCGHSLGAGVAALLGLTWADPHTCKTVPSSGLPSGRRVSIYCFGPPCVTDVALGKLSRNMITSFVYSHDVVSRLSLGSVRDMTRSAAWLCAAARNDREDAKEEGHTALTTRALKYRAGLGKEEDAEWFLAMRKTLEANMHMADLFPPGRVLWALRDGNLHPTNRLQPGSTNFKHAARKKATDKVRLFDVPEVEKVFGQIEFAGDMLMSHMPHRYDQVLHELL